MFLNVLTAIVINCVAAGYALSTDSFQTYNIKLVDMNLKKKFVKGI